MDGSTKIVMDSKEDKNQDDVGITMNLRKFRKATAKKRLLDNHKEKKKRKKSDNISNIEEPETEMDQDMDDKVEEPIDTTSESNTMTLEQFTDIVLASEGMTINNNNKEDQEEREKKAMVATILQNKDLTVEVKSAKSKPVVLSPRENCTNFNSNHSTVVVSVKPRVNNSTYYKSNNLVEEWLQKMPVTTIYEQESTPSTALNLSVKRPLQYSSSNNSPGQPKSSTKPCIMELSKSRAIRDIQLAHTKDVHGNFPLHMSVLMRKPELVKRYCCVLQILESSIDLINEEKLTPLHLAVRDNSVEIIEMLVAFGANPSIRDFRGNTSLHMATAIRSSESLKILAESVASKDDINAFNNFGITPLHIAMMNDDKACVDLLLRYGADPKILNDMAKIQPISKEMKKESVEDHMNPAGFPRNNVLIHS